MSAVLLLAYRRWQNIEEILELCRKSNVSPIYIHIDSGTQLSEKEDVSRTLEKSVAFKIKWDLDIRIVRQEINLGCAVSMITSLNAVFQLEEQVIILEDDCIPSSDFFPFMEKSMKEMKKNHSIAMGCGAQFAPREIIGDQWMLSRYPLNWGWGINKTQWGILSSELLTGNNLKEDSVVGVSQEEMTYWNAGSRRALAGYTDVWDILVVREMIRHNLFSILPAENLVRNVGNDAYALHTQGQQLWTNFPTGNFVESISPPLFNTTFDNWIRTKFYGISRRHIFSTKVTQLLDQVARKRQRQPLAERIQFASVNFDS